MKKMFSAMFALLSVLLFAGFAHAADPAIVVSVDGVNSRSIEPALIIDRDTSAGYNRLAITYPGTSGTQYIKDDASWTQHTKAKNYLLANGGLRVGTSEKYVAVRQHTDNQCSGSSSVMQFPNTNNAITIAVDGCAFWQAVKNL